MLKNTILLLCLLVSTHAYSNSPNWNYVVGSYETAKLDSDFDLNGYSIEGSMKVTNNIFINGKYMNIDGDNKKISFIEGDQSVDVYVIDNELTMGKVGVGYLLPLSDSTDFYTSMFYEYIDIESKISGVQFKNENSDYNFGASIGIKSQVTDNLELNGSIGHMTFINDSTVFVDVSTYYLINDMLSIGVGIFYIDDLASARLSAHYTF